MIPISVVTCEPEQEALVLQVLRSGKLTQGAMVERFEALCCEMTGARHAIAVNNGTTALVVALEALRLRPGDEVITSAFTFVATLNAILESGATARFADVDSDDFNMSPASLAPLVNERTRVVMPVHLYGQPADLDAITQIADRHDLAMIEDAAQAHGARYRDTPVGSTPGQATFSFYATKNLQSGEGGVVTTDDDALAERLRLLRNHGMRARYQYEIPGHNYRLTEVAAAIAIPQFDRLAKISSERASNADYFSTHLADLPGVVTPVTRPDRTHAWHQYTLRITKGCAVSRDELLLRLNEAGIGAGVYYPRAVYDYDCYRTHPRVLIGEGGAVAERVATEVISLPVHQHLTESDREFIVTAVRKAATPR
ncbi:MAG: DegT/DnrJ/EryC1/StrS family aminotransferase [Actinobacteria bacterium]|nr:DegT/DnrJ/EryC1/StrS family aminotransferase [Actinomycetota bacterium]